MITKNMNKSDQIEMISIEQLVPEDHILRKIDKYIDFSFIYDLVEDKYDAYAGRPSVDPVVLIKIPMIQYMFGIKSMRQTIKDIEVNMAYRWFLGLGFRDKVPHFSTFGKNYKRRFENTDLFEQIFTNILMQCMNAGVVDTSMIFVDATHVKAAANNKKAKKILVAKKEARIYDSALREELNADRESHGKKPFDFDDDNDKGSKSNNDMYEKKVSTTDEESGWFHKGEHKSVFAYNIEVACECQGWILAYTVHPGNEHDSKTFPALYDKIKIWNPDYVVADAAYKTPAIAKTLIDEGITPVFPYTRPHTKDGFFRKNEYVYDEYYDCYICPNNEILTYSTTTREGRREYKSDRSKCAECPYLSKCTASSNTTKVVTRHLWETYIELCEEIRHTKGMREVYNKRKETIERSFGTAKEHHGMRYTHLIGKAKMSMKVGLTFACMNMRKLANLLEKRNMIYA